MIALCLLAFGCGGKDKPPVAPPVTPEVRCVRGGCGGQICEEEGRGTMTTCEARPEHACYATATCERQASGACGWTETPELAACVASPPPFQGE